MRWPRRRRHESPSLTADSTQLLAQPTSQTAFAEPAPLGRRPRTEWSRVAALEATITAAPLTFHGDRFGHGVAGAQPIAASMRHRPGRAGHAPAGVLLDVATIESIEPMAAAPGPTLPEVAGAAASVPPIHRKVLDRPALLPGELMRSDITVEFPPPSDPQRMAMSWTSESGFAGTGGRPPRGASAGDADPTDADAALRYVPAAGPRHERAPRDLADLVARATGVSVSDAVIDRSPEVSDRAAAIGAIAFTERATVHLPAELGELDSPATRAVVAHELTHVAQQRLLGELPSEHSPEGEALEAQARAVQRGLYRGVRPHFIRTRRGSRDLVRGAQRLADDDDAFSWQDRPDLDDRDDLDALGFGGGLTVTEGGWLDRRRAAADARRSQQLEQVRQNFEFEHRTRLQATRDRRYQEIVDETLRERRTEAARQDEDLPDELTRADLLHVRQQLDEEMPWEFGVPEGIDPYPGTLPPETGQETVAARHHADHTAGGGTPASTTRRAAVTGTRAGRPAATGTGAGGRTGTTRRGARPGAGTGAGAGTGEDSYAWQQREPTDQQAITAMFGGGLFGDLLMRAAGPETDDDRRQAEAERLPELLAQRHEREKELRHATLSEKLRRRATEAAREEKEAESTPIVLTSAEITSIREQIDRDMPIQYATPTYLPRGDDSKITDDGEFRDATDTEVEAGRAAEAPTPAAHERAETAAAAPAPQHTTADTAGATPATPPAMPATTAAAAVAHEEAAPTPEPAPEADHRTGDGEPGASRVGTALAIGGGVAVGRLADRLGDDDEPHERTAHSSEHAVDEEAAGRIFAAATDLDLDSLSRRIWSRIRREMRSELLIDRERAGTLADL